MGEGEEIEIFNGIVYKAIKIKKFIDSVLKNEAHKYDRVISVH